VPGTPAPEPRARSLPETWRPRRGRLRQHGHAWSHGHGASPPRDAALCRRGAPGHGYSRICSDGLGTGVLALPTRLWCSSSPQYSMLCCRTPKGSTMSRDPSSAASTLLAIDLRERPSLEDAIAASAHAIELLTTTPGNLAVCETITGSLYFLFCTDGDWCFWADNTPGPLSRKRDGGPWVIEPLDALLVGAGMLLMAPRTLPRDDSSRAPGGGKRTSLLVRVEVLAADRYLAR
jgi:hypothetical protein